MTALGRVLIKGSVDPAGPMSACPQERSKIGHSKPPLCQKRPSCNSPKRDAKSRHSSAAPKKRQLWIKSEVQEEVVRAIKRARRVFVPAA